MPAKSKAQYGLAQSVLSGKSDKMPKKVAEEIVKKTKSVKKLPKKITSLQDLRDRYKELTKGK